MAANAVRLIRSDHRRLEGLVGRLSLRYREGPVLRGRIASELRCHAAVTREELLPFARDRLAGVVDATAEHEQVLHEMERLADEIERADDPVPPPLVEAVRSTVARHTAFEEDAVLQPLERDVDVLVLRHLGERTARSRRAHDRGQAAPPRMVESRTELYEKARRLGIEGRAQMSRAELAEAIRRAKS